MARNSKNTKVLSSKLLGLIKRHPGRLLVVVVLAIGGLIALQASRAAVNEPGQATRSAASIAAEQIIVRYKPGVEEVSLRASYGRASASPIVERAESKNLRMKVLKVPPSERAAIITSLQADPTIESAEPDSVMQADLTQPNDPQYRSQASWPTTLTDLLWDKSKGSTSMVIGVIDTGINKTHPEFAGRIVQGKDFVNNDDDPVDDDGHGSVVSSILAANSNDGIGIAGACWSCKIMPVKVLDAQGAGVTSNILMGIDYAVANGAKILNLSYGGYREAIAAEKAAIDNAVSKGVLVIASAGNKGVDEAGHYPSLYDNVISVAATEPDDSLSSYSNFGTTVDIAAPGKATGAAFNSDGYITGQGTSYAAPTVGGIAAVLRSAFPNATIQQIRSALTTTTDPCCGGKVNAGRVNAIRAYHKLAGTLTDTTKPSVTMGSPSEGLSVSGGQVPITASATDNVAVAKIHAQVNGGNPFVTAKVPAVSFWGLASVADGNYTAKVTSYDATGNSVSVTRQFAVNNTTPADTVPPTLTVTAPAEGAVISGTASPIKSTATDNKSVALVEVNIDDGARAQKIAGPYDWTLDTTKYSDGAHKITVQAVDSTGKITSVTRNVTITNTATPPPPPPPPTVPPTPPNPPNPPTPPNPTPKPGDLNNDGKVNITDLSTLLSNWGKTNVPADLNKSGRVDISDLSILLSNWTR